MMVYGVAFVCAVICLIICLVSVMLSLTRNFLDAEIGVRLNRYSLIFAKYLAILVSSIIFLIVITNLYLLKSDFGALVLPIVLVAISTFIANFIKNRN